MSYSVEVAVELEPQVCQKQVPETTSVVAKDENRKMLECRVTGVVKWFDPIKGLGFIVPDAGGPDILLHASVLRSQGIRTICQNTQIETKIVQTERGFQVSEIYAILPPLTEEADDDRFALSDRDAEELHPARVKWFNATKDFGFANAFGDCSDIFLSGTIMRRCGLASLHAGEAVSVSFERNEKGPFATMILPWDVSSVTY